MRARLCATDPNAYPNERRWEYFGIFSWSPSYKKTEIA